MFLFLPCPQYSLELQQFVSGSATTALPEPPPAQELAEKLLPWSVQELLADQKVMLCWVDTS